MVVRVYLSENEDLLLLDKICQFFSERYTSQKWQFNLVSNFKETFLFLVCVISMIFSLEVW